MNSEQWKTPERTILGWMHRRLCLRCHLLDCGFNTQVCPVIRFLMFLWFNYKLTAYCLCSIPFRKTETWRGELVSCSGKIFATRLSARSEIIKCKTDMRYKTNSSTSPYILVKTLSFFSLSPSLPLHPY